MSGAIAVHTHILPPRWDDWAARFGSDWPRLVGDPATQCQLSLGQTFNMPREDPAVVKCLPGMLR